MGKPKDGSYGSFDPRRKDTSDRLVDRCSGQGSLGQEYTIGARRLRRADLAEIRQTLEWLDAQPTVEDEQAGRGLPRFISMLPGRRF